MNTKLYYHKTDGGAEYLCTSPIEGTDEGDLYTAIVRLDGEPELVRPLASPKLLQAVESVMGLLVEGLTDTQNESWGQEIDKLIEVLAEIKANG